jgi:mannose-6-phosphate isomerase-like protein (cupin superfamily)
MSETEPPRRERRTGRPLDDRGRPTDGPALRLRRDGAAADLLEASPRPLVSSPGERTWACLLERPDDEGCDTPVLLQWLAPDAASPPAHVHPTAERFEVLRGTLTVVADGRHRRLAAGETLTVPSGVEHTFHNGTDGFVAFRAELPSMRTVASLYTAWGLGHERSAKAAGRFERPGPLDVLPISEDVAGDTTTTVAPLALQRLLWHTVGRAARALGHTGIDESYLRETFWTRHVEQPTFDGS